MECCEQKILNKGKDYENEPEILIETKDNDKDSFLNKSKDVKQHRKMSANEIGTTVTNDVTRRSDGLKNKTHISFNEDEISLNNFIMNAHTIFNKVPYSYDGQYKQVALRHQAMLVTRGALNRFGRVNKFADKEKDNVIIDNK